MLPPGRVDLMHERSSLGRETVIYQNGIDACLAGQLEHDPCLSHGMHQLVRPEH